MQLLQKENELQEIIQLVGPDALPPKEQVVLEGARAIRENFLQQNAFHEIDTYCPAKKQYEMMRIMLHYYNLMDKAIEKGVSVEKMKAMQCRESIGRMATVPNDTFEDAFAQIEEEIVSEIASLGGD
jgi:V/A-type H+-transporting ATPase subunit A